MTNKLNSEESKPESLEEVVGEEGLELGSDKEGDKKTVSINPRRKSVYAGMWGPNEFTCNGLLRNYDGLTELAAIQTPTLITCGEFDEATPASCKAYVNLIPDARYAEFENASHLTFVDSREKYIETIRNFLTN